MDVRLWELVPTTSTFFSQGESLYSTCLTQSRAFPCENMAAAVLQSRSVGALACQKDSYLTSLDVEVVSCTKFTPDVGEKSSKSKAKPASSVSGKDLWQIEFTDSVLFPEGISFQHSSVGHDHEDS